jgi:hypothetical protein
MTVRSSATSLPTSSVAFVEMPVTWPGTAPTDSVALILGMRYPVALVGPSDVSAVEMTSTGSTRYVIPIFRNVFPQKRWTLEPLIPLSNS